MSTNELNVTALCADIHQKIIDKCDYYTIDNHIQQLCSLYIDKWKGFTNSDKTTEYLIPDYIGDTSLVFSTLYEHYGCEEALKEINECLLEEPDAQSDVNEYLQFIENLNIARNMTENDFKDENYEDSKLYVALTNTILYIQKKNEEMRGLSDTMKQLSFTLKNLDLVLETMITPVAIAVPVLESTTDNNDSE